MMSDLIENVNADICCSDGTLADDDSVYWWWLWFYDYVNIVIPDYVDVVIPLK